MELIKQLFLLCPLLWISLEIGAFPRLITLKGNVPSDSFLRDILKRMK